MYLKFNKGLSLDGFRGTNLVDFPDNKNVGDKVENN